MAKWKRVHTQAELEGILSNNTEEPILLGDGELFYSSLEPVPKDLLGQTEEEFRVFVQKKQTLQRWPYYETRAAILPRMGEIKACRAVVGKSVEVELTGM